MELSERLNELKNQKKNQELLDDLKALLSLSKQDKDSLLAMETLMQTVETMRYLRQHDEAIALLETEVSQDFFGSQEDRLKLIEEMIKTLLRTEDFIKMESVLHTRERYLVTEHQKVMQKFYYAVCYEGLREYRKAIDVLKSIKDTISSSNLVSKYLKLAMLYLKENDLKLARENFSHAEKFDRNHQNPIFSLAESDILYAETDYLASLAKYQEYFIKSRNKHRYLDRFILINLKLDRLDEAWKFYHEYLPTMSQVVSKNYRLIFYEAGLELANRLKDRAEIEKLTFLIDELEPSAPLLDRFDSVYRLLSVAFQNRKYAKSRDIILNLFRSMNELYEFQKVAFIVPQDEMLKTYHLQKNLLLEKDLHMINLAETLLDQVIREKPVDALYAYDDLIQYPRSIFKTVDTAYVFASGISTNTETGFMLVYTTKREDFDFQQKLVLLAAQILRKQLSDFEENKNISETTENLSALVGKTGKGLVRIENNIIRFLDQNAKSIFGVKEDYLVFEDFQSLLKDVVFLDDLLYTEKISLSLKNQDKTVDFILSKSDFTIYALVSEAVKTPEISLQNDFFAIGDERLLLKENLNVEAKSLLLLEIRNYLDYFRDHGHERYKEKLEQFFAHLKSISRNHYDNTYLESFNLVYLTLSTIDKRVLNRITDAINEDFGDFDIRIAVIQINRSLGTEKLVQLRYLLSLTTASEPVAFDNRNYRYSQELAKSIQINVNNLIQKKSLPLSLQAICDWHDNTAHFWLADVSALAMLGEKEQLKRVLHATDLEGEFDILIASVLAKEAKKVGTNRRYLMEVDWKTLGDRKLSGRLIKKAEESGCGFLLDLNDEFDRQDLTDFIKSAKAKELPVVGKNFVDLINIRDITMLNSFDYLVLKSEDLAITALPVFLAMLDREQVELIFDHGHKTLRKSELEHLKINLVIGDAYPKHENVTGLKT